MITDDKGSRGAHGTLGPLPPALPGPGPARPAPPRGLGPCRAGRIRLSPDAKLLLDEAHPLPGGTVEITYAFS